MFTHAIVRTPGENFAAGITTSDLGAPDYEQMVRQHEAYIRTLESLGLRVERLDPLPDHPDAHFVEDVAIVTPDVAVVTNPGAPERNGEKLSIEPVLAHYRSVARIEPPGTLDGGDVLAVGRHWFIGISGRTNRDGCAQLGRILERHGNTWTPIVVEDGLHLKSAVNHLGGRTLLVTWSLAGHDAFVDYERIVVDDVDAYAANTLWVNDHLITPSGFPRTRAKLEATGLRILELDMSEAQKMDGGLTCLSLRF